MGEPFWFKARFSWGRCFSLLDDHEISSLVKAIWQLSETGEDSQPIGKAGLLWPMISSEICQDASDRENGKKGGRPPKKETGDINGGKNPPKNLPLTEQSITEQSKAESKQSKAESEHSTLLSADGLPAPAVTKHRKPKTDSPGFEEFWASYPKRQGKAAAKKAWNAIAPDAELLHKILSAIEGQKKNNPSWQEADGKYIPMPSTWLHGNRWEDEMQNEKVSSSKFEEINLGVTL